MTERTEEEVEWLNRIRTMEKLDRELFTKKETFYAIKYESEKEIRDISKMVKDSWTTSLIPHSGNILKDALKMIIMAYHRSIRQPTIHNQ